MVGPLLPGTSPLSKLLPRRSTLTRNLRISSYSCRFFFIPIIFAIAIILFSVGASFAFPPEKLSGTLYGHLPYKECNEASLLPAGKYRDTGRSVKLNGEAAIAFIKMRRAARGDGVELLPISGFRKLSYQERLFTRAAKKYGSKKAAAKWVAPPGYSEHHTGLAVDIGDKSERRCDVESCFEETPSFEWLKARAEAFGFELSFSPDGVISYEPWHWRYVGEKGSK